MPEKNENQKTVRKGREHYSSAILHQKRDQKRIDAEIRDREYQSLSVEDRLKRVKSRRGESKREIKRLTKLASVKK